MNDALGPGDCRENHIGRGNEISENRYVSKTWGRPDQRAKLGTALLVVTACGPTSW